MHAFFHLVYSVPIFDHLLVPMLAWNGPHTSHDMTHIYSLNLKNTIGLCELPIFNITALVSTHLIYILNIILKLLYIKVLKK